ncbi:hypothetical protein GCM10009678_51820 [Actinomadura kijaniata]|uniref:Subtilisin family serine protease n=1 Tax=Actinomadura namibiensis TaxID=182080 RepID=A0A7W3QK21_ACTNM|nr:S8 family peptidase [Actinomadura namibiensis]MBA8950039.1 subtilisin family serine protease [Actinomadura namibiensis]
MRVAPRRALLVGAVATAVGAVATVPVLAAPDSDPVPVQTTAAGNSPEIPGKYIVTVKDGASLDGPIGQVRSASRAKPRIEKLSGALNGFAAKLDAGQLNALRNDRRVEAIEPDRVVKALTTQKAPLPWGLDRIDQRGEKLSKTYTYRSTGKGVTAYVIDDGIDVRHPDFGGRAKAAWTAPALKDEPPSCMSHGTHVAGTIGSKTYGVAKGVQLRAVKVLDCEGNGELSDVIAGLNWVRLNAAKPAVANMSLGVEAVSPALNKAADNLAKAGVFVSVAAGNEGNDACQSSPASASRVMAVGASTKYDNRATFSDHGRCVDVFAPGYGVYSTLPNGRRGGDTGTSMASPHAAGVAALYLGTRKTASSDTVFKWIIGNSTPNALGRIPRGTPNRLLYKSNL